jgi:hypothetical protein
LSVYRLVSNRNRLARGKPIENSVLKLRASPLLAIATRLDDNTSSTLPAQRCIVV